ncbi:MAG: PEP-CTERM sorting domain-containing protein [Pseudomonadota bacterium]
MKSVALGAVASALIACGSAIAAPVTAGGFTFDTADFADVVVDSNFGSPAPTDGRFVDDDEVLGAPDFSNSTFEGAYTLGSGGDVTVRFTDNALTGSDSDAADLFIFEIGPDVEDTFVEISVDGIDFIKVGKVTGATSTVDIDPFLEAEGIDPFTKFFFVKLIDDPNEGEEVRGGRLSETVGADIDAIGALTSVPVDPVPVPGAAILFASALAAGGLRKRLIGKRG